MDTNTCGQALGRPKPLISSSKVTPRTPSWGCRGRMIVLRKQTRLLLAPTGHPILYVGFDHGTLRGGAARQRRHSLHLHDLTKDISRDHGQNDGLIDVAILPFEIGLRSRRVPKCRSL